MPLAKKLSDFIFHLKQPILVDTSPFDILYLLYLVSRTLENKFARWIANEMTMGNDGGRREKFWGMAFGATEPPPVRSDGQLCAAIFVTLASKNT